MKKLLLSLTIAISVQTLFAGLAGAAYLKGSDKKISINTGLNLSSPINTGETSFQLQEAAHNDLTTATGAEVDHYYLWVELDGQDVLAVDPAKGMY